MIPYARFLPAGIVPVALAQSEGGCVEPDHKELVRLKIARLNDCFT